MGIRGMGSLGQMAPGLRKVLALGSTVDNCSVPVAPHVQSGPVLAWACLGTSAASLWPQLIFHSAHGWCLCVYYLPRLFSALRLQI